MSNVSVLQWQAHQLTAIQEAVRISNGQGDQFLMAMTAPGRIWTITGATSPAFNSKTWKLDVATPRSPYIGFRFRAAPFAPGVHRYTIKRNGTTIGVYTISGSNDHAHIHKLPAGTPPRTALTMELMIEAQTQNIDISDVQIFACFTNLLPGRCYDTVAFEYAALEVLTTS